VVNSQLFMYHALPFVFDQVRPTPPSWEKKGVEEEEEDESAGRKGEGGREGGRGGWMG